MPNRILKESVCTSDTIASLSDFEYRVWTCLILLADDAGRGDARPAIIKGRGFPLRDRVTSKDIDAAVHGLAGKGCISLYTVGGKSYYYFPTWSEHQRVRDVKPKYPAPEESAEICGELPQSAAGCGVLLPESESNTNPNYNPNPESKSESDAHGHEDAFDRFWKAYPKKTGKQEARKAFKKVSAPVSVLVDAIEKQKTWSQWKRDNGQYIPNPSTWLNQGRWEDEEYQSAGKATERDYEWGSDFFESD